MCATIKTTCNENKSYLVIGDTFYGFKKFRVVKNKIYPFCFNEPYRFDENGFTIPKNKIQRVLYGIGIKKANNYNVIVYNTIYKQFNKKLGYHIMPISLMHKDYELHRIGIVKFDFYDIQLSDGDSIVVNRFKIPDSNYEKIYDMLVRAFGNIKYKDNLDYFNIIINNTKEFSSIVKKQIGGKV